MPIPQNAQAIYQFLTSHGLSANAAAGILGNIEQESGGNPSAGSNPPGSGLIQQLGYPTGQSLANAMAAILTYIAKNGSIADINAHAQTPQAAATYFSDRYERPGTPNLPNRIASANEVAAAAASGNWSSGTPQTGGGLDPFGPLEDLIRGPIQDFDKIVTAFVWFFKPENWVRIIAGFVAVSLLAIGVTSLVKAAQ